MTHDRDWVLLGYLILIIAIVAFLATSAGVYYW